MIAHQAMKIVRSASSCPSKEIGASLDERMRIPLSVVLPTRNRLALLRCTLECILPQLKGDDEVVVLVEGPNDESYGYLQSLVGRGIRIIHAEGRVGGYLHYRLLFEAAKHDAIVMVHDDELYRGDLLSTVSRVFATDTNITFVNMGQLMVLSGARLLIQSYVRFLRDNTRNGLHWVEEQVAAGMYFNCSCLVFRRDREVLKVLDREQISADNLFVSLVASKGSVRELPIFASTWLLHAGNTSKRDYLTPGHSALWEGFARLKKTGQLAFLSDQAVSFQRRNAIGVYTRNALAAAAVDGNKPGYRECLRQISLAGGNPLFLRLGLLPGCWFALKASMRLIKRWTPLGRSSQQFSGNLGPEDLASVLDLPKALVRSWLDLALAVGSK
jgi:glycosyltransferase involved in cell wall biosynthesis